eukprot:655603-Pyramimonas_sp.AAC.1
MRQPQSHLSLQDRVRSNVHRRVLGAATRPERFRERRGFAVDCFNASGRKVAGKRCVRFKEVLYHFKTCLPTFLSPRACLRRLAGERAVKCIFVPDIFAVAHHTFRLVLACGASQAKGQS